jgi:hypothetical protein
MSFPEQWNSVRCACCTGHLADDVESGESSSERVVRPKSQSAAPRFQHYEVVVGEDGRLVELGHGAMGVTYKRSTSTFDAP